MLRLILLSLLLLPAAHGQESRKKEWWKINCLPLQFLDAQIRYCTENTIAVKKAQACYDELMAAWTNASVEVAAVQSLSHAKGQEGEFGNSNSKYQSSISRLRYLVDSTARDADLLAEYPTVMVDRPMVTGREDSLPCYQDAFNAIQKLVTDLDKKTKEGKAALAEAEALQGSVQAATGNLKATDSANAAVSGGKREAGMPKNFNKQKNRLPSSTITGEIHRENSELPPSK